MELADLPNDGESKTLALGVASANVIVLSTVVALGDVGEVFFCDAGAVIEHLTFKAIAAGLDIEHETDVSSTLIVLHGILNEVAYGLFEQGGVGGE